MEAKEEPGIAITSLPNERLEFLNRLRRRTAQAAIGASALRNQGAPGVVEAARTFLEALDLRRYTETNEDTIVALLDKDTDALVAKLPEGAQNWGAARKALNLFLRDATYNIDLSREHGLANIRPYLEVPLDNDVATGLKDESEGEGLSDWTRIKHLDKDTSRDFQAVARKVAKRLQVDPVDLDVFYWRPSESKKQNDTRR